MGKALFALALLCCAALVLAAPEEAGPEGGTEAGGAHYKQSNTTKLKRVVIDETKPLSTAMKCCITLLITYFIVQVRVCARSAFDPAQPIAHCPWPMAHCPLPPRYPPVITLTPSRPRYATNQKDPSTSTCHPAILPHELEPALSPALTYPPPPAPRPAFPID